MITEGNLRPGCTTPSIHTGPVEKSSTASSAPNSAFDMMRASVAPSCFALQVAWASAQVRGASAVASQKQRPATATLNGPYKMQDACAETNKLHMIIYKLLLMQRGIVFQGIVLAIASKRRALCAAKLVNHARASWPGFCRFVVQENTRTARKRRNLRRSLMYALW